jgi:hypothetical protein
MTDSNARCSGLLDATSERAALVRRAACALLAIAAAATSIACRNDPAPAAKGANPVAASAIPVGPSPNAAPPSLAAPAPGNTLPRGSAGARSAAESPLASASTSTSGLPDPGCSAGAPGAPLPKLEKRSLAAKREGRYRFELEYPLLRTPSEKTEQKVNRALLDRLATMQKRFVKDAEQYSDDSDPENARWFEGKCAISYDSPSFVSVACETMEGPGAHPNVEKFAHNFRICPDVKALELGDLCRSLPECKKRIVDLINEDFRAGDKKQTGIQFRSESGTSGGAPDPDSPIAKLQSFGITPSGLRVYLFDELPHVLQAFAIVDIPVAKVRSVLREDVAQLLWGG